MCKPSYRQTVHARVVGDLPVALGMEEMMRQVRSLQLAVTGVYVDGEGAKNGDCPPAPATAEKEPSKSFLTTDVNFYNKQIIGMVGESSNSGEPMQSPVDLRGAKVDQDLGPISFHYTPIWAADPEPWSPGALSGTVVSPQPTVVKNTGLSWEVEVARHHQLTITHGPLHEKDYRLAMIQGHWGGSEHSIEGKFFDGEIHLVHHHLQYPDVKVTLTNHIKLYSYWSPTFRRQAGMLRALLWWPSSSPSTTSWPTLSWRRLERFCQG